MLVRQVSPESLDERLDALDRSPPSSSGRPSGDSGRLRRLGRIFFVGHLVTLCALALSNLFHGLAIVNAGMTWRRDLLPRWQWQRLAPLLVPLGLYVICLFVSVALSYDRGASVDDLDEVIALSTLPLAAWFLRGARSVRRVVDLVIAMVTLTGVYGMVQFYFTDLGDMASRIPGPFSHYQTFAGVLLIGDMLLIARLAAPHGRRRVIEWLALVIVNWTLILTLTRGSWVALAVAFGVLVVLRGRRRTLLLGLVALFVAIALAPASWQTRAQTIGDLRDPSNYDRLCMLEAGAYMVRERPLFGIGPNVVRQRYAVYRHPTAPRYSFTHLHNSFVQQAAERGLLSLATYLWLMVAAAVLAYRGYRTSQRRGGDRADLYLGVLLVLVAFNVAGLFEANWRDSEVQRLVLFVLALPLCLMAPRSAPRAASTPTPSTPTRPSGRVEQT